MLLDIIGIVIAVFSVIGVILVSFSMGNQIIISVISLLIGVIGVVVGSFLVTKEEKRRSRSDYSMPSPSYVPEPMKPYNDPFSTTNLGDGTTAGDGANGGIEGTTTILGNPFSVPPEWLNDSFFSSDHTVIIDDRNLPYGSLIDTRDGREYRLDRLETDVGRSQPCRIVIPDRTVSKRHAILRAKLDQSGEALLTIEDLSSSNGTIVNAKRIHSSEQVILHDEDVITVGETQLKFHQYPYFQDAIEKMSAS